MSTLSGGEAARASLAAVLLARFDVFLLDEPTNDLDFAGLAQLERFVLGLDGAAVLVSHDRTFLDRTVTDVFELDEHSHRGRLFGGGWAAYLEDQAVARRHAEEAFAQFEGQRDNLVGTAQRTREWAAKGALKAQKRPKDNDKIGRKLNVESSEKLAGKASRAERALERLDVVDKPWEPWQLQLELKEAPRSGAIVARLRGAVIDRGEFHLGPIDLELAAGERLAVLGPNGSGKSTLISALLGQIDLTEGEQWVGPGAVIGIVDQRRTVLDEGGTVLEAFTAASGMLAVDARTLLAKFGLVGDHVRRSTATLSPGERTRALLALFMAKGTNCLVLDEPTNHLDLPAIEQLEQALETWTGTLVLVTHDRSFLEHVRIDRELRLS
jgi:ATPase subunit of ABC transporter with duplicated ATPase domains